MFCLLCQCDFFCSPLLLLWLAISSLCSNFNVSLCRSFFTRKMATKTTTKKKWRLKRLCDVFSVFNNHAIHIRSTQRTLSSMRLRTRERKNPDTKTIFRSLSLSHFVVGFVERNDILMTDRLSAYACFHIYFFLRCSCYPLWSIDRMGQFNEPLLLIRIRLESNEISRENWNKRSKRRKISANTK